MGGVMRDYGKVHTSFWASPNIRTLSDDGRTLALYLLTCPHGNLAGAYRIPDGYVAEDLGWHATRVAEAFAELFRNGFANRCETTKWVWITKFLDWNPPENPNQRKAALKIADQVPDECDWKPAFMRVCSRLFGTDKGKKGNGSGTVTKPFRNQEQEQEQEQEQKQEQEQEVNPPLRCPPTPQRTASAAPPGATAPPPKGQNGEQARAQPAKQPPAQRAARLPATWRPDLDLVAWTRAECPHVDPDREAEVFRDYWTAQPGAKGTKLDWPATWRNWCRRAEERGGSSPPMTGAGGRPQNGPPSRHAALVERNRQATEAFLAGGPNHA